MWKRFAGIGAAILGLLSPAHGQATAPVTRQAAPAAWVEYAGLVQQQFESQLGSTSEAANRLGAYLAETPDGSGVIAVRAWVDGSGFVTKVAFSSFLNEQANADLIGLLQGTHVRNAPPVGILLPIRLNLHIAPSADGSASN